MKKHATVIFLTGFLLIEIAFAPGNAQAFPPEPTRSENEHIGKSTSCSQCHTLTTQEAGNILYQIEPTMTVSKITESPVSGLWEVLFENNGKKGMLYIPYSKKHLIAGMVIEIATGVVDVKSMKEGYE